MISHRDFKQFKKTLTTLNNQSDCLEPFEELFKKIENQEFPGIHEYFTFAMDALNGMNDALKKIETYDISMGLLPDAQTLILFFDKVTTQNLRIVLGFLQRNF